MAPFVILAQPLYGSIDARSHSAMCEFVGYNVGKGLLQGYRSTENGYIDWARNTLVESVLTGYPDATHLLFVDQDMVLPLDTLERLLQVNVDVVSAVYFDKAGLPCGWKTLGAEPERLDTYFDGLQRVAGFGMGAMLIRTSVFKAMAEHFKDKEWFRSTHKGEDKHFCERLEKMGVPVWLDGRIVCGHMKDMEVGLAHYRARKAT